MGGAVAAAGLAPLALAQRMKQLPAARPASVLPPPNEVATWEKLIGATFVLGAAAERAVARLVAIERPAIDPLRPPELARFQPFIAWFEMDARLAPAGQRTHAIRHPTRGATELFLSRGADRRGKAVLYALFN
jgi:hypothetical protein